MWVIVFPDSNLIKSLFKNVPVFEDDTDSYIEANRNRRGLENVLNG